MHMNTLPGITIGFEDVTNREASNFFASADNYKNMVRVASCMKGVDPTKAEDLVHDVLISIMRDEENGEGFVAVLDGVKRSVADFVYGRLKGYSKNDKYTVNGKRNANGQAYEVYACGAYNDDGDIVGCTAEQFAYEMAASYDDLESIEARMALNEEFTYMMTFQNQLSTDLKMFFRNIKKFIETSFNKSILDDVKSLMDKNADFNDAMRSVIRMYASDTDTYYSAVACL